MCFAQVRGVSSVVGVGLHNPLMTHGGFPVVDGVVTSFNTAAVVKRNAYLVPLVEKLCPTLARLVVAALNPKTMHYLDGAIVEPWSRNGCTFTALALAAGYIAARYLAFRFAPTK